MAAYSAGAEGEGEVERDGYGTLKMWNAERGYGFIADDAGGPAMVFCTSARCNRRASISDTMRRGERLTFDVESTRDGKTSS
jgi:cold shock CspA family protein